MRKLEGKVALVTGGSSGIGLATAKLFSAAGAQVAITGRDAAKLEEARREIGQDAFAMQSDAGDLAQIEALMSTLQHRFDRLDVLFVNAGVAHALPSELVTPAQFEEVMGVNFRGAFFTIQKALPLLRRGASVIVMTSIVNRGAAPQFVVYAACKAAQRSMIQSLGVELIGRGIRVNGICGGPIETPMYDRLGLPPEVVAAMKAGITARSPIQRWATAEEIGKVALFLAGDDSSYLVGEEIVVDGAMNLLMI
jgi:NAD(P)-dependent dehydrogenase (short-subunit alcohol dehydrogenase family)